MQTLFLVMILLPKANNGWFNTRICIEHVFVFRLQEAMAELMSRYKLDHTCEDECGSSGSELDDSDLDSDTC